MNVFRHHYITADNEIEAEAHRFKRTLEEFTRRRCAKVLKSVIAAKSDEMKAAGLLIANKPPSTALRAGFRHECIYSPSTWGWE